MVFITKMIKWTAVLDIAVEGLMIANQDESGQ
jgi:hypothetical protein